MSSTALRGASASTSTASGKRRWTERDWDVLLEAQTFVAVYAESTTEVDTTVNTKQKKPAKKTRTSTRTRKAKSTAAAADNDDENDQPAPTSAPAVAPAPTETFWLAQLQDDVTEDMVEYDTTVRVTWLNRVASDSNPASYRYTMAYDEWVDVQAILCHVYLTPISGSDEMELTAKSLARVERSVRRTKGTATPEDEADSEDEAPPRSSTKTSRRSLATAGNGKDGDDDDDGGSRRRRSGGGGGGRRIARASATKKVSKRIAAMHIPPQYATVTLAKYADRELLGDHAFDECKGDVLSSTRELMRAVRTQNYDLLKLMTEDKTLGAKLHSFRAYQSADVEKTPLQYAIEAEDVKAIALLQKALKASSSLATGRVSVALPSHSTGAHTSSYSDYNRRPINASRGGREGNNALLEDYTNSCADSSEDDMFLWEWPHSSVQLLTVFYPAGEWANNYSNPSYVAACVRVGNYKLASKLVQVLEKNGGWGYNDLHVKCLSSTDEPLPTFRSVSVLKKAQTTKITPLHFAATNPNVKYLEALFDSIGAENSGDVRDDAGFEPIHYAAVSEAPDAAKFLLEKKNANLLSRTKEKHTPLMRSLIVGREATAIAMLEHVSTESSELCTQVLSSRGPSSYQLIHFAAEKNRTEVLKHLLKMGVNANVLAANQTTPLSLAARQGHYDCVKILLDHGAKVDKGDKLKKTPLMYAVKNGHTRLAAMLINYGANVNAYDTSENSIVHYAACYGWLSCLELLHDAGADLWSRNSWGFVPLICAMLKQRMVCAEYMLQRDAESRFLDFRDRSGCTMLYLQCQHSNSVDQIKYLLEKGLSPNVGDADGVKPLDILINRAARDKSKKEFAVEAIRALIQHGAEVKYSETTDDDGVVHTPSQPLHTAIRSNLQGVFEVLLNDGNADPFFVEADGKDAWLTSAGLGYKGAFYLNKLLERYPTPGPLTARYRGGNIFHAIAASVSKTMVPSSLITKLFAQCTSDPSAAISEKNTSGLTPIMMLLSKVSASFDQQGGGEFIKIARLFAEKVTDIEAFKVYKNVLRMRKGPEDKEESYYDTVLDRTILHDAVRGNTAAKLKLGVNLVDLLLATCPLSKTLIDVPELSSHLTPLLIAVNNTDNETIKLCLANGADVNYSPVRCRQVTCYESHRQCEEMCAADGLKDTALIVAAKRSHHVASLLLESGATTDCVESSTLNSPLHCAVTRKDTELTKLLLQHGASMITRNASHATPLFTAVSGDVSVETTPPHEGEVNYTTHTFGRGAVPPMRSSIRFGGFTAKHLRSGKTVVDILLQHATARDAVLLSDELSRTVLHHAAMKRNLPLLTAVLAVFDGNAATKTQYVNARDVYGRSALHFALNAVSMKPDASFDIERFLLLSGADVHTVDNFGLSPLHYALVKIDMDWHHTYDRNLGTKAIEEQKFAGTYETLKHDAFARHLHAASSNRADPVETLSNMLAAGCDPLACDALGRLPMHLAASAGGFVCVSTLLSACPASLRTQMLEHRDVDGFTPLGRAFLHARETTITTLIQSGAVVSNKVMISGRERSYFSVAVEKGMSGICHMLLNAGFSRRQAVEDAVSGNQLQLAKNLIVGLEVSSDRGLLGAPNSRQQTLLHCLAMHVPGFGTANALATELAWSLVDQGVQVTAQDDAGNTALHYAAQRGNLALMDFLLHHKADVNQANNDGDTPLFSAIKTAPSLDNRIKATQYLLLSPGLDLRRRDAQGFDVLALMIDKFQTVFDSDDKFYEWLPLSQHGSLNEMYPVIESKASDAIIQNPRLVSPGVEAMQSPLLIRVLAYDVYRTRFKLLALLTKQNASASVVDSHENTVLMYLVARNLLPEATLVVTTTKSTQQKKMLDAVNRNGFTALHLAVQTFDAASYENVKMVDLLLSHGASIDIPDAKGETVVHYAQRQKSQVIMQLLETKYKQLLGDTSGVADVEMEEEEEENYRDAPAFADDAKQYLDECQATNKITKVRYAPTVDDNVDVGAVSSVYGLLDAEGKVIEGEEYHIVLTKVDVKSGRFGVNVFYKTQVVHDELQDIYIVFTNWGRIDEEGKYQNTPFHSADEAVAEFKKIFKAKTSNAWEDRHAFEKKRGKYSLVDRVNYHTRVDQDVTKSFAVLRDEEQAERVKNTIVQPAFAQPTTLTDPSVMNALFAITDVRHLALAATERCSFSNDLPLARDEDLRAAMEMLRGIRQLLEQRVEIKSEMDRATSALATEDTSAADLLTQLAEKFDALTDQVSEHSSRFYEIVPRNEAQRGAPIGAFTELSEIDRETERLTQLLEIAHTYKMLLGAKLRQKEIHPIEYIHDAMQIQFSRLAAESDEYALLTRYFTNGIRPSRRSLSRVSNIFEIKRRGEADRLASCMASDAAFTQDNKHTVLLWHGTRRTNLMGILSEGLRIAPRDVPRNGAAFGKGIYFSDVAELSMGYCDSPYTINVEDDDDGGDAGDNRKKTRQVHYMLLCEVALGNQVDVNTLRDRQDGVHSIRAFGRDMPDEQQSLVATTIGVQMPMGTVGVRGQQFACDSAWAVNTSPSFSGSSSGYSHRKQNYSLASWSIDGEAFLNRLLETSKPWTSMQKVEITSPVHKKLFIRQGYGSEANETYKLEVRITPTARFNTLEPSPCDVGVEFVVTPPPSTETAPAPGVFSSSAFGSAPVRTGFGSAPAPTGFTFGSASSSSAFGSASTGFTFGSASSSPAFGAPAAPSTLGSTQPQAASAASPAKPTSFTIASARRYRHVLFDKPPALPKNFSLKKPDTIGQYNQHIVYSPEQVRLRYLVEVDNVGGSRYW